MEEEDLQGTISVLIDIFSRTAKTMQMIFITEYEMITRIITILNPCDAIDA